MVDCLLSGYKALDLTDEKGFVCGKLLSTLGVEVIKVEKPGGDTSRLIPPFVENNLDMERSLYWLAFNTGKRSITLNLNTKQGQKIFKLLAAKIDFIIESFTPGYLKKLGLDYESLSKINPRIIIISITPFGQKGPYAHYQGSELIFSAMGGIAATTGDPDRAPLRECSNAIYYEANAAAAVGAAMAHYYREISGEGQQVDISIQEVPTKRIASNLVVWEFDKRLIKRAGTVRTIGARSTHWIWPCKDGYIFWSYMGGKPGAPANRAMSQWIDDEGIENPLRVITNWDEFDMAAQDVPKELLDAQQDAIGKFFLNHTKKEIMEGGLKRGLNACAVNNPADILDNEQLKARNYWAEIKDSSTGKTMKYPKYFFLSNVTENYVRSPAPVIGEYNGHIYKNELMFSDSQIQDLKNNRII